MSQLDRLRASFAGRLRSLDPAGRRIAVALSGGVDSVVLLDLLAGAATGGGFVVTALHVHHGLSPNADAWAQFCAGLCRRYDVPLRVERVRVAGRDGGGVEAAARAARYRCYRALAADYVACAHHLDDQAETVFLQMLRGAGPAGLAAMPFVRSLGDGAPALVRPLIDVPREAIVAYAQSRHLAWVEDESNADGRFARNYLRLEVLPALRQRFPGCMQSLGRTAENCADAAMLVDALAAQDVAGARSDSGLRVSVLLGLGEARAANALRYWLRDQGILPPPRERLREAVRQLTGSSADANPQVSVGAVLLRRYRDALFAQRVGECGPRMAVVWRGEPALALPDGRHIRFEETVGAGVALARLAGRVVSVRARAGGERFRPDARRPRRALKKLLQESGVPPWERGRLLLVFADEELAWVEGFGPDASFAAAPGERGLVPVPVRASGEEAAR